MAFIDLFGAAFMILCTRRGGFGLALPDSDSFRRVDRTDMRFLRQFSYILAISFLGELLRMTIPAPIPASVYGMAILFAALKTRVIKLEEIETTGAVMLAFMPLALVPAAVGLVDSWQEIKRVAAPGAILILGGTLATIVASGAAAQFVIRRRKERKE